MIVIRTTKYYKPHFGAIIPDMEAVGYSNDNLEVFQYSFTHRNSLYEWLSITKLKIRGGTIWKGSTAIGAYEWGDDNCLVKPKNNSKQQKGGKPKRKRK